jgi:ribonucleotide monophosphatase NagD (HAD superfamily)
VIALHKGKFWRANEGLKVDIGAFIAGLEYATGKEALVIGKPSPSFFQLALDDMALSAGDVAIIGDDIDADVGGGIASGLKGILVKTGKYREDYVSQCSVKPDWTLETINELIDLL